ncbi:MAG: valine--tRNA ligase [Candidatus Pacebacteria bacterium]|nr:valine--tRNA ligase [Candidatus Paceibacterota bacterium]
MEKRYKPQNIEKRIYDFWEKEKLFTPKIDKKKKPFTILLPPPNANDPLHVGHALYVVEDILCRYHHLLGDPTLFLPGTDHAGIETQYVFEKSLKKQGKSRFDFDQKTLYKMIDDFVEKNRGIAKKQLKRLGFSLDWSREKYTLEPDILKTVLQTFRKLHNDKLIYRAEKIVNYCTHCGTAFSNLEINHKQEKGLFYYLDYGSIQIATTRPETIFADTAVAVNPKSKKYKKLIGKKAILPLLNKELPIIADKLVDSELGTGALKITPGHDLIDFEIGQRHNLEVIKIIDFNGKMINLPTKYLGMNVSQARKAIVEDLKTTGKLLKIQEFDHSISTCYRCNNIIEPMLMPQWFVKIKPLADPAIKAVKNKELKIIPKRFEKLYFHWMENIIDWNISRQIVWGPRIPAWYCLECNPDIIVNFINKKQEKISEKYSELKNKYDFSEIKNGLQKLTAPKNATYSLNDKQCEKCKSKKTLQETDTFDTWFSSGQWPLTTLGFPDSSDFKYFYPTSVLDTMWDILFFWVARMVMFGIYRTGKSPFKIAHMHCRIVDSKGQKMSKSKNNVINPMEMIDQYGADALRISLVFGAGPGSDISLGHDKLKAMRNFTNKIWNAARFVLTNEPTRINTNSGSLRSPHKSTRIKNKDDEWILKELNKTIKETTKYIDKYRFDLAAQEIYQFFWHCFCDKYIEMAKNRKNEAQPVLLKVLKTSLILLHPFMPFITEEIYQKLPNKTEKSIMAEKWPEI